MEILENFQRVFPFAKKFLDQTTKVCVNFPKIQSVRRALSKKLDEDVCNIICPLLEENIPDGILNPEEIPEKYETLLKGEFEEKFLCKKGKELARIQGLYFFGVYSKDIPKLVFDHHREVSFIKTSVKKEDMFFYAVTCPFPVLRGVYTPKTLSSDFFQVYWYCDKFFFEIIMRDQFRYPGFFGDYDAIDPDGSFIAISKSS